jgi:hypothetical protein
VSISASSAIPNSGIQLSHFDGVFDMAANGGGRLTVRYAKAGYLRSVRSDRWQEFTLLPTLC